MSKPRKPYKTFPLTPHVRGGWCKHYKGRYLYIPQHNAAEALAEYHRRVRAIDAGSKPTPRVTAATVGRVATRYLEARQHDVDAGRLGACTLNTYTNYCGDIATVLGCKKLVADLLPDDFTALRRAWERRLGSNALAVAIQVARSMFSFAADQGWIEREPRYGRAMAKPPLTRRRARPFSVDEARLLVAHAGGPQLRAMILLGINAGYGPTDCAKLPRAAVDLDIGMVAFPRPKMAHRGGIDRAATLWPETIHDLARVMEDRQDDELVFRTAHGRPWVRESTSRNGKAQGANAIGAEFADICIAAGVEPRGFYGLRHLHRTLADEVADANAAARIMGHRLAGMAAVYVDAIEHDRLRRITDHIRARLWPLKAAAPIRQSPP